MSLNMNRRTLIGSATALMLARPTFADGHSAVHEVAMLNRDPDDPRRRMVFGPTILEVKPGDTIKWLATDRGHNAASTDGMIPEGAEAWNGRINEEIEVTLNVPGVYGYHCTPHQTQGMVGLIVCRAEVGDVPENLEAAKEVRQRGRAAQAWEQIWEDAEAMGLLS
ncbi:pseudoazurin [Pontivivens insulae]|uniref:Pseudoazurin n=1 Tax=Pontivivens insulae TaxID=1639689 RepID=A0A2R8AA67_9RHOB|nr:pseudoazurin [Pontivivens insulae]RED12857.1 pseudoazurin [Pontivivens insulae]SPF28948.1 Pseudoazurin [Pontivivens insulae]